MILSLEQQVAPLDLCQRLKELGAPQETLMRWYIDPDYPGDDIAAVALSMGAVSSDCAAFTVAELTTMVWTSVHNRLVISVGPASFPEFTEWHVAYWMTHPSDTDIIRFVDDRLVVALARVVIALAERGVVKWPEVKS